MARLPRDSQFSNTLQHFLVDICTFHGSHILRPDADTAQCTRICRTHPPTISPSLRQTQTPPPYPHPISASNTPSVPRTAPTTAPSPPALVRPALPTRVLFNHCKRHLSPRSPKPAWSSTPCLSARRSLHTPTGYHPSSLRLPTSSSTAYSTRATRIPPSTK